MVNGNKKSGVYAKPSQTVISYKDKPIMLLRSLDWGEFDKFDEFVDDVCDIIKLKYA